MNILLTGGAGYIGSHVAVELLENDHTVIIVDNLSNSSREAVNRIERITLHSVTFYENDIRDSIALDTIFGNHHIDAVIHFAGLKSVSESTEQPLKYYDNNLIGTISLLEAMQKYSVSSLIFSSSATVYGTSPVPYTEKSQTGTGITNPYGRTKYMIEEMLKDISTAHSEMSFVTLRYFNPVGAHQSGLIGEDPSAIPNNLMPYMSQVAIGKRDKLHIFGNDYPTVDGTGVRDYIHVVDLAKGHVAALNHIQPGLEIYNLGSGKGTSVLQLLQAYDRVCENRLPFVFEGRRPGDLPEYYANADKAKEKLGWQTTLTVDDMCADSWRWQSMNPDGYRQ